MGPKPKKDEEDTKARSVLQVLLPLANVPMIDYTLEWLASSGVDECFVFCCAHSEQVKEHLELRWAHQPGFRVTAIVSHNCSSAGDALRFIDQKNCIRSDFVLVSGDTVTNLRLAPMMDAHRTRRERDKLAILTVAVRPVDPRVRRESLGESDLVVVTDPTTGQLLHYEEGGTGGKWLQLDAGALSGRPAARVRTALADCCVDVCAPELLYLFSDNFDYQHLRRDAVAGILGDDATGHTIHVHDVTGEYSARVHNLRSYDAISRDVLQRWAYPMVPDTNVLAPAMPRVPLTPPASAVAPPPLSPSSSFARGLAGTVGTGMSSTPSGGWATCCGYRHGRGNMYVDVDVTTDRSAILGPDAALGRGTTVAARATVRGSVVGRGCTLGHGCSLDGCYLGDGVWVGAGTTLTACLICDGVTIGPGSTVGAGCLVSYGVVIGPGVSVPPHSRLTLLSKAGGDAGEASDEDELETTPDRRGGGSPPQTSRGGHHAVVGATEATTDSAHSHPASAGGVNAPEPEVAAAAAAAAAAIRSGCCLPSEGLTPPREWQPAIVGGTTGVAYLWRPKGDLESRNWATWSLARMSPGDAHRLATAAGEGGDDGGDDDDGGDRGGVDDDGTPAIGGSTAHTTGGGSGPRGGSSGGGGDAPPLPGAPPPLTAEAHFGREVSSTVLRCVIEGHGVDNARIELNALKLAEDREFWDLARYAVVALVALVLPPPPGTDTESVMVYAAPGTPPPTAAQLTAALAPRLAPWAELLKSYARGPDAQVELLLTLEEYAAEEGVFRGAGGAGVAPHFQAIVKCLYDAEVATEQGILQWAAEKAGADDGDRVYLDKCARLLTWLREASSEEDEGGDD